MAERPKRKLDAAEKAAKALRKAQFLTASNPSCPRGAPLYPRDQLLP